MPEHNEITSDRDSGLLHLARNDAAGARLAFMRAFEADQSDATSCMGLAEALRRLGQFSEAEARLRDLVSREPTHSGAWSNLGVVFLTQNRREEAVQALQRAVRLDARNFGAHLNLVNVLCQEGRHAEAEASARAAIDLQPGLPAAYCTLGAILMATDRGPEAEGVYRRALELDPNSADALDGLAQALADKGDTAEAVQRYVELGRRTGALEHLLAAAMLQPIIPASLAEIDDARGRATKSLTSALTANLHFKNQYRTPSTFNLAYQGRDDRPIMEALDAVLSAKAPELSYVSARTPNPLAGRRVRVGFVSQALHDHTVGRVFRGLLQQLDRSRFEVFVAHLPGSKRDHVRSEIDGCADLVLELARSVPAQRLELEAAELDLLFFTDIGMGPASYQLARSRLAPVQAVGWGHPDTTGLRTIDYYVSWDLAEPEGAEAHYTERLVRLPRLACYYEPLKEVSALAREEAGLPGDGALYGCLQSLFKLHPDFDAVLAEIVSRDPTAWLVFAQGQNPSWEMKLRRRWASFANLGARAIFLPRRPTAEYLGAVAAMDVLLDPPHFGSGNTFYDAMAAGVPVVTWRGAFARGRIVSAAYSQMRAGNDLVVSDLSDYAARAVAAAHADQTGLRAELQAAARAELFTDLEAVRGFERFLLNAVESAP